MTLIIFIILFNQPIDINLNTQQMSNYSRILETFIRVGYNENSSLNQYEIASALDKIAGTEFNREVAQQLYEQTSKEYGGDVVIKDYITTIIKGQQILERHIKQCNDKLQMTTNQNEINDTRSNLAQYIEDYKLLTQTFNIRSSLTENASQQPSSGVDSSNVSGLFTDEPSNREQMIALVSFCLEMVLMFAKHHFLSMLTYLAILGIFLLNYFDMHYIKSCLIVAASSVLFDLIWIIAEADDYWNPVAPTQRSTLQPGFLRFTYIMTLIMMINKAIMTIMLFRYRNNDSEIRKKVKLLNLRFDLDGKPKNSPLHNIWTGAFNGSKQLGQQRNYTS